ncbi:MAG TPA: threonylcarbamoyl-AMP synthase, partial [Clostridiales bacterium]|nr:threonylcarbamoyl-AMP synthase [Clostridiales bacterium]
INVDLYIDDGPLVNNLPSTVVEIENNEAKILREGKIKEEDIIKVVKTPLGT